MAFDAKELSEYRSAFAAFAQKARQAQALTAAPNADPKAVDAALLELERARVEYNHRRDSLARALSATGASSGDAAEPYARRVSEIAEMRWELAGKPEGTAEDDWYRAEEIVRCADAA